jgi:fucose permease
VVTAQVKGRILLGCVVTPLAGRCLDWHGSRRTVMLSVGMSISGLLLTLARYVPVVITGLADFSSGILTSQSAATVLIGQVAKRTRSSELHTPNRPDTRRINASCGSAAFGSIE